MTRLSDEIKAERAITNIYKEYLKIDKIDYVAGCTHAMELMVALGHLIDAYKKAIILEENFTLPGFTEQFENCKRVISSPRKMATLQEYLDSKHTA